jgi:murein DD-endopeptidase MepM/ murein hydrolase activator NlpD
VRPPSISTLEVLLDPAAGAADPSVPIPAPPSAPGGAKPKKTIGAVQAAAIGTACGLVAFVLATTFLVVDPLHLRTPAPAASAPAAASASAEPVASASAPLPGGAVPASSPRPGASEPGPWRISAFEGNAEIRLVDGTMERKSFLDALTSAGVPKAQVYRIMKAFQHVKKFEKAHRHDAFVVALDRATKHVKAFEYQASATEVYQAREGDDGKLVAEKLDLKVERRRVTAAVVVGDDLAASCRAAGLDEAILETLDDALEGRVQLAGLHRGSVLRIVAQEESALGKFARYSEIEAVEYRPPGADAQAVRVYHFAGKKSQGYFDGKGRAPYKGGWRSPIPFARISSRFNPKRRHPILHIVMPHNGVDFAASTGTPVYSASFGTVSTVGPSGPSGNLVVIDHPGSISTCYCHLSRFAAGLKSGQKVETHQLIGYVGTTGRSTGPHLHFCVKKNGIFVDPLTLKLDGERVLPKGDRTEFEASKAELDQVLDAIPLPARDDATTGADGGAAGEGNDEQPLEEDEAQPDGAAAENAQTSAAGE